MSSRSKLDTATLCIGLVAGLAFLAPTAQIAAAGYSYPTALVTSHSLGFASYITCANVDRTNGYAYFGTVLRQLTKVQLSPYSEVGTLVLPGSGIVVASAIDEAAGFGYFGQESSPGTVTKVRLSDFTIAGTIALDTAEGGVRSTVVDPVGGYLYLGLSTAKVVRVRLSDFTRDRDLLLNSNETWLNAALIDATVGYAYFGCDTSPARIVKIRLADFTRDGALVLDQATENGIYGMSSGSLDLDGGIGYFVTDALPVSVVKIRLSDMAKIGSQVIYDQSSGSWIAASFLLDTQRDLGYSAIEGYPEKIAKYRLSDMGLVGTVCDLGDGNDGPVAGFIDPLAGYAWFGTYTQPARVVQMNLGYTTTSVTSAQNPVTYGQPAQFTASVSPVVRYTSQPSGYVTFTSDGSAIAGCGSVLLDSLCQAACATSSLLPGTHSIHASFQPDTAWNSSEGTLNGQQIRLSVSLTAGASACSGAAGQTAFANDLGAGATYAWTINNGTITSGAGTRTISFTAGESGSVTLGVSATLGTDTASATKEVPITAAPSAAISAPASVCGGATSIVASVPDAGQGATYAWAITNGTLTGGADTNTASFTAGSAGSTTLAVTVVSSNGCSSSSSRQITINPVPSASISAPSSACGGSSGLVASVADAGAGASYAWTITNGAITAGAGTRSITFTAGFSGTVDVSVVVTTAAGCSATASRSTPIRPTPSASFTSPSAICVGSSVSLSVPDAGPGATYSWGISNANVLTSTNLPTVSLQAPWAGTVNVSVNVTLDGCSSSRSASIAVLAPSSATISGPSGACANSSGQTASVPDAGQGADYTWTIQNGNIASGAGTRTITFDVGSTDAVLSVTVRNAGFCTTSGTLTIPVRQSPNAAITAPPLICSGSTGNVASVPVGEAGTTYSWTVTGGTITAGQSTRQITFTAAPSGTISITATARINSGCADTQQVSAQISPSASAQISMPSSLCYGSSGNIASVPDAGQGATYTWAVSSGTIDSGNGTPSISFTTPPIGAFSVGVTVQAPGGCATSSQRSVSMISVSTPIITASQSMCAANTGTASTAQGYSTYAWSITNGTITSSTNGPSITFVAGTAGTATLDLVVTNSGCSARVTKDIVINPVPSAVITAPASVCNGGGAASVPDAGSGGTYYWSISNGTITSSNQARTITFTPWNENPVTLSASVSASGCSASSSTTVAVRPTGTTLTAPASVCSGVSGVASVPDAGPGATYSWAISNAAITSGAGTRSIVFAPASSSGSIVLGVTVTTGAGCTASVNNRMISILLPPVAAISAPTSLCPGALGSASAPSYSTGSYVWTIGNGAITSGAGTPSITFTAGASGSVSLAVTITQDGCSSSASATTSVVPPPSGIITAPGTVCAASTGNTATVPDAGSGGTYTWSVSGGTITAGTGTRSITWTAGSGTTVSVSVTVTNSTGCAATGSTVVGVAALPSATITAASSVRKGSTNNTASVPSAGSGASYTWSISNGTITSGAGTASIKYRAGSRGTLILNVTVRTSGGCQASGTTSVTVTN